MTSLASLTLDRLYDMTDALKERKRFMEKRGIRSEIERIAQEYSVVIDEITRRNLRRKLTDAYRDKIAGNHQ